MKLIIYDYEVFDIKIPFPYLSLTKEVYKEWLKDKLEKGGFDLNKKIVMYYSNEYCGNIYEQDK